MSKYHVTARQAVDAVKASGQPFVELMKIGAVSVEYYSPVKVDLQSPHLQDELYLIARGHGFLIREEEKLAISAGDVIYVPAHMPHRFVDFSDDFATWVVFFPDSASARNSL